MVVQAGRERQDEAGWLAGVRRWGDGVREGVVGQGGGGPERHQREAVPLISRGPAHVITSPGLGGVPGRGARQGSAKQGYQAGVRPGRGARQGFKVRGMFVEGFYAGCETELWKYLFRDREMKTRAQPDDIWLVFCSRVRDKCCKG